MKKSLIALVSLGVASLPAILNAASYNVTAAGTPLDYYSPSSWTADGAAATTAPTNADILNIWAGNGVILNIDGGTAYSQAGNYGGSGEVNVSNGATWNMGYAYTMGEWEFNFTQKSTMTGFFAFYMSNGYGNFDDSTLNGNIDTWGNANAIVTFENGSTLNGNIRYVSGATNASISVSFEDSVYNGRYSTEYQSDEFYTGSTLNLSFIGSKNDIQMGTLKINNGKLSFVSDADGFTVLNVESFEIGNSLSLEVDFRNMSITESKTFELVSVTGILDDYLSQISTNFLYKNEGDYAELAIEGNSLVINYTTSVPEPSTYAVIFGALALAFVAYRRRK